MNAFEFSIIIPVYNSANTLEQLFERLNSVFIELNMTYEVVFVNDCSSDSSMDVLKKIHKQNSNVKIIELYKNFGQHNAVMCGFSHCKGEYVITIDDDLQNPPEEIPKLIGKIKEGFDVAFGIYVIKQDRLFKNIGSYLIRKLNHLIFGLDSNLKISSFRIIRREVVDLVIENKTLFPYIPGLILQTTMNIGNVIVKHEKRKHGKSNYTFMKLLKLSFNLLINYSTIPLMIVGYLGLIISVLSFSTGVFFLLRQFILGQAPAGWTTLVVLISFYNTLILVIFFIIGEYLSRLLKEASGRKQYLVRRIWE